MALFITEQSIKETSIIDENVDMKLIGDVIELSQEKYILPVVGSALYNELVNEIDAGSVSIQNQTLLNNYLQPALKWWILYEGVEIFTYKVMNKSIVKKNSENSTPIDIEEVRRLMEKFRTNAELYSQRAINFLIENSTTYTLYSNYGVGHDTIKPIKNIYTTSIWLGDENEY